jgi:agmatinase
MDARTGDELPHDGRGRENRLGPGDGGRRQRGQAQHQKLWISFDIDVLDPAFMPGTGTPVPGGLTMREAQPIFRRLCAENEIVGIDLVEVAPYLDTSYKTAYNSAVLVNACLAGIAMHKRG